MQLPDRFSFLDLLLCLGVLRFEVDPFECRIEIVLFYIVADLLEHTFRSGSLKL